MDPVQAKKIGDILKGDILILGIGNVLKHDDGFGSILARHLAGRTLNFKVFDLEGSPENMMGKVLGEKADTVLIVDCVSFDAEPGAIRVFDCAEVDSRGIFFTHNMPLGLVMSFIKESSGAAVYLLGVQPGAISLGEGLTEGLHDSLHELEDLILRLDKNYVLHDTGQSN